MNRIHSQLVAYYYPARDLISSCKNGVIEVARSRCRLDALRAHRTERKWPKNGAGSALNTERRAPLPPRWRDRRAFISAIGSVYRGRVRRERAIDSSLPFEKPAAVPPPAFGFRYVRVARIERGRVECRRE